MLALLLIPAFALCAYGEGSDSPSISRGETAGNSYSNSSIDLHFTKPSD